jgi:hypothetical protein
VFDENFDFHFEFNRRQANKVTLTHALAREVTLKSSNVIIEVFFEFQRLFNLVRMSVLALSDFSSILIAVVGIEL